MQESREREREEQKRQREQAESSRNEFLREQEAADEAIVLSTTRWTLYILERPAPRRAVDRMVLFERKASSDTDHDREFRVWSESYREHERWSHSEGHVEGRDLFLGAGGYQVEIPLSPRLGEHWGLGFVLVHGPVEIDGREVRRLERMMVQELAISITP